MSSIIDILYVDNLDYSKFDNDDRYFVKKYLSCTFNNLCCELTALRYSDVPIIAIKIVIYK